MTLFSNAEQAIAKAQAGDYDQQEVAARLQSYIEDNKVCTSRPANNLRIMLRASYASPQQHTIIYVIDVSRL